MKISSLSDLEKIANNIQKIVLPGDSIFLYGEIGVGKTTFARLLINNYELENTQARKGIPSAPSPRLLNKFSFLELFSNLS